MSRENENLARSEEGRRRHNALLNIPRLLHHAAMPLLFSGCHLALA